jgi:phage terminase large subunit-like protein
MDRTGRMGESNPVFRGNQKAWRFTNQGTKGKAEPHWTVRRSLQRKFNIWETVKTAWLSFDAINNTETLDLEEFRGAYCIGGIDLSITTDLTCASLLFMHRGSDKKYIHQMYWLPADRLQERVQQDKIPYDKWFERGLLRLCSGNTINYSDVNSMVHGNRAAIWTVPGVGVLWQLFRTVLCGRNTNAWLYNGALHTGLKNAFPAYVDVRRRLAGAQGQL